MIARKLIDEGSPVRGGMLKRFVFVGALAWLPLASAAAAKADDGPAKVAGDGVTTLALFPVVPVRGGATEEAALEMSAALRDELNALPHVEVAEDRFPPRPRAARRRSERGAAEAAQLQAALEQIESGKRHLERLRLLLAIRDLRQGIKRTESYLTLLGNHDLLVEAHLHLATAYFRKGRAKQASRVLEQVVPLRPTMQLDTELYPPIFIKALDDARARVLSAERGRVEVEVDTPGSQVWLNGRPIGAAPIIIEDVIGGRNHLVVRAGAESMGVVLDVPAGSVLKYAANFARGDHRQRLSAAIASNRFDAEAGERARRLARAAGASHIALFGLGKTSKGYLMAGMLGNVRSGEWTRIAPVTPDPDLIAASIDARAVALDVAEQLEQPKTAVGLTGTVFFLPLSGQTPAPAMSTAAPPADFAPIELTRQSVEEQERQSAMVASRALVMPVGPASAPATGPQQDPELALARSPELTEGERPQGSPAAPATVAAQVPPPVFPQSSRVVRAMLLPPTSEAGASKTRAVAALDVTDISAPYLGPDGEPITVVSRAQANVWGEWWFWTAVGMGVAVVAGSSWLLYSHTRATGAGDGELIIEAKW